MKRLAATVLALAAIGAGPAYANDFADQLTELANGELRAIAQNPELVAAVIAQNAETAGYDQAKIDSLDGQWRAEVDVASKPLIDSVLSNPVSALLTKAQDESEGLLTEIFAMDGKGLNVGQSSVTSDYWQGDEGKWQNTYLVGADAVDISEVEQDESTQVFQSQVSLPVVDATGTPVGAITFGVNVEML